jgi:hypothetical protein
MLKSLVTAILQELNINIKIVNLKYLRVEQLGVRELERRIFFDIYCELEDGTHIVIEMQNVISKNFENRMIYYLTYPIRNQMPDRKEKTKKEQPETEPSKRWDYELKPVYEIVITNKPMFRDKESKDTVVELVQLVRRSRNVPFSEKVNLIFVDLSKHTLEVHELKTVFDFWMYTLKYAGSLLERPEQINTELFIQLYDMLRINKLTPEEMKAYKESVLSFQTLDLYLEDGDTREARGRTEGIAIGEARGIEIGEAIGRAEGEARVRTQMILNCAAMGMSAKTIAAVANLPVEQVQAILQNRK